jgi:hypothetical protein
MLQAKGMSADNEIDTTLKQSETIQMIEAELKHQLKPNIKILVIDCFGRDSEEAKKADLVNIDFNAPVVISNKEKAEAGLNFSTFVSNMVNSGMPLDMAIQQAQQFYPEYEIDEEDLERLGEPNEMEEGYDPFDNLKKTTKDSKVSIFNKLFNKNK